MPRTAVFWIRDGVLVDRMHVNPVAFAVACLAHADPQSIEQTTMTALVNFGFETSGISCADKMRRFNGERFHLVPDVAVAAAYYNALAGEAASHCQYFDGACELVERLKGDGVLNFITSAVEQSLLDTWALTPQGKRLAPHLTEILGKRPDCEKGEQHFKHVCQRYGVEKIFYVADAVAEIANGAQLSNQFNISPIGFAHVITPAKVRLAHKLVMDARSKLAPASGAISASDFALNETELCLPDENALTAMLKKAQATCVVGGNSDQIINNLATYFQTLGVLTPTTS
jgi:phosphoglycolate phosphatase-like HAD superfamily hydrolase